MPNELLYFVFSIVVNGSNKMISKEVLVKYFEIEFLVYNEDNQELIVERTFCSRNIFLLNNATDRVSKTCLGSNVTKKCFLPFFVF